MVIEHLHGHRGDTPQSATPPKRPRSKGKPWAAIVIGVGLVAAGVAGGWFLLRPPLVQVEVAATGEAVEAVYASGVVEYVHQADIAPVVTAPIRQVRVIEGQSVRKGQTLAQLDDGPQLGTTLQLEAQAALSRATAARTKRLYDAGFGARAAYEDALKAQTATEAAASSARARLADYRVTAPFAAKVIRRDAEPGDLAMVGKVLFVVADPSSLRITADIDERDVGKLAAGLAAVVRADAYPNQTFPASISEITPQGDSTGRTFRARLSLDPQTPLRPGMTVETNLVVERRKGAILIPSRAVKEGAVFVVDGERVRRRDVRLGVQGAESSEVLEGVSAGERVVLSPMAGLKDGDRVRVQPTPDGRAAAT